MVAVADLAQTQLTIYIQFQEFNLIIVRVAIIDIAPIDNLS